MTDHIPTPGTPTRAVPCPACMAAPGEACTAPDDRSRHAVSWLHLDRVPRESYPSRYGVGVADPGEGFGAAL
jgi:hypothetical protein